jgi:ATP-dependent protease ClpP protease subunit
MARKKVYLSKLEEVHDRWIDTDSRELWIHGVDLNLSEAEQAGAEPGVEYMMATKVIKNLHILRKQSPQASVVVHLHTCGGCWEEGIAIYDNIVAMPYPVVMVSHTHARSMSSIILQAADKRVLMPSSYFMFHRGTYAIVSEMNAAYSNVKLAKKQEEQMLDIYVEAAMQGPRFQSWSEVQVRKALVDRMNAETDVFLSPEEAVDWGFADSVFSSWPRTAAWGRRR